MIPGEHTRPGGGEHDPASSTSTTTATTSIPTTTTTTPTSTTTDLTSTTTLATTTTPEPDLFAYLACDPYAQDCPPGQKCAPYAVGGSAWNATKCVDITGDGAPGDPCTAPGGGFDGPDDCALGAFCWDVGVDNQGTCVRQCSGSIDDPFCPPGYQCHIASEAAIALCLTGCDPLAEDCPNSICVPNGDGFICAGDASAEAGQTNDPCEFINSCDPGLACLDPASASSACDLQAPGCCQPFCALPDGPCPNPDQQCVALFDPKRPDLPPDYKDIGTCRIPS